MENLVTLAICNQCGEIPESAPLFQCPFYHQFCTKCFHNLRKTYRVSGSIRNGSTCGICNVSGDFMKSQVSTEFLLEVKKSLGLNCTHTNKNNDPSLSEVYNNPKIKPIKSVKPAKSASPKQPKQPNQIKHSSTVSHIPIAKSLKPPNIFVPPSFSESSCRIKQPMSLMTTPLKMKQIPILKPQTAVKPVTRNKHTSPCRSTKSTVTVESLFQLSTTEVQMLLNRKCDPSQIALASKKSSQSSESTISFVDKPSKSREPIQCPHHLCKKVVSVSSFVSHFKNDHRDIAQYILERGEQLTIPCDFSVIKHNSHYCLAVVTLYEVNKIDVKESKSSRSVIKTCSRFNQKVPLSSFWVMVSGSQEKYENASYAIFWLFTTGEDDYQNTIELASACDSVCLATFCAVNKKVSGIIEDLNCLLVPRPSLVSMLRDGPGVRLRITVH